MPETVWPTSDRLAQPHPIDLIHDIRAALGWPVVAMGKSPKQAFEECLDQIRWIRLENDRLRRQIDGGDA